MRTSKRAAILDTIVEIIETSGFPRSPTKMSQLNAE